MNAQICLEKLQHIGVLNFATVDSLGNPQVRCISAIHYEPASLYFFTARGKHFCQELLEDGRVQILGYTREKEMIRLSGRAASAEEQERWIHTIFTEQPYLSNVYPGKTREIGMIFCIQNMEISYFNLAVYPIFRETYQIGTYQMPLKGYQITDACVRCGICAENCPQQAILQGTPYVIMQEHCLHCGNCWEHCPIQAIQQRS